MLVSEWTWTDRRDGTTWTVAGTMLKPDQCMGPLLFKRDGDLWYAASCGVIQLTDEELQRVLDKARNPAEEKTNVQ